MADRKISDFSVMIAGQVDSDDTLPIVDASAGPTDAGNKRVTILTLQTLLGGTNASIENAERAELAAAQAALYEGPWLDDVAGLLADTALTYDEGPGQILAGQYVRTRAEGYSYQVVESDAADYDVSTDGGVKMLVIPLPDGWFPLGALGPDDTGAEDITPLVQRAVDRGGLVQYPPGSFLQSDVLLASNVQVRGAGKGEAGRTTIMVGADGAAAFRHASATILFNVKISDLIARAASGVTGAAFYRQANRSTYLAYAEFSNIETWLDLETSYEGNFIFTTWDQCRDGYFGSAPGAQTHRAISSAPAAFGQVNQANLNLVRRCRFFRASHPDGCVTIDWGYNWVIEGSDFEQLSTRAIRARSVPNLVLRDNWYEAVNAAEVIQIEADPDMTQGSQAFAISGGHCYMHASNAYFVQTAAACSGTVQGVSFAAIPAGAALSNNLPANRIRLTAGLGLLSGAGVAGFTPRLGAVMAPAFASYAGTVVATVHDTFFNLMDLSGGNQNGTYIVSVGLAALGTPTDYSAVALISFANGQLRKTDLQTATLMLIGSSGTIVQAKQQSGSAQDVLWSITRLS